MASTDESKFLKGLGNAEKIANFLNLTPLLRASIITALTNLKGRQAELADPAKKAVLKSEASTEFDAIMGVVYSQIEDKMKNMRKFAYAMNPSNLQSLETLYTNWKAIPKLVSGTSTYENYLTSMESLEKFTTKYATVVADLRSKSIMKSGSEEIDIDLKRRKKKKFEKQTGIAAASLEKIETLKTQLTAATTESDKALIIQQIDAELAKIDSTNAKLERLKKKDGKIGKHQHSITVPATAVAELRNRTILDHSYDGKDLDTKLTALHAAHQTLNSAATAGDRFRAMKAIKKAERALYGHRMTARRATKIDAAMAQRDAIVAGLSSGKIEDFDKTMKKLKKLDKQIIGRKNAKALYTGKDFGGKPVYLVGGTSLIVPKKIAELRTNIDNARKI